MLLGDDGVVGVVGVGGVCRMGAAAVEAGVAPAEDVGVAQESAGCQGDGGGDVVVGGRDGGLYLGMEGEVVERSWRGRMSGGGRGADSSLPHHGGVDRKAL